MPLFLTSLHVNFKQVNILKWAWICDGSEVHMTNLYFKDLFLLLMYMRGLEYASTTETNKGIQPWELNGFTGICVLPDVGTGNWAQVLWSSSTHNS